MFVAAGARWGSTGMTLQTGLSSGMQRRLLGGLGVEQTKAVGPCSAPFNTRRPPFPAASTAITLRIFLTCRVRSTATTVLLDLHLHAGHGPGPKSKLTHVPVCVCFPSPCVRMQVPNHPLHALPTAPAHVVCSDRPCVSASVRRAWARVTSTSQMMACW
jgi:hypothetical protein